MSNYILLDAAARRRLAFLVAQIARPDAIPIPEFRRIALGQAAAVDFAYMAVLCDTIPNLLAQLRSASLARAREEVQSSA